MLQFSDYAQMLQQTNIPALLRDPVSLDRAIFAYYHVNVASPPSIPTGGGAYTTVDFATKVVDTHGAVVTGANWRFTCPATLFYIVATNITLAASSGWALGEYHRVDCQQNGAATWLLHYGDQNVSGGTNIYAQSGARMCLVPGATGDTIHISTYQTSGAALNLHNNAQANWVAILGIKGF